MLKSELIMRSPIRVFEETLGGGLGAGNLGVLTARKGVGKTATLVHIATDKLLRGQNVLHISFADDPKHIVNWYENLFNEMARTYKLENTIDIHESIIRKRLILHFKQTDISFQKVKKNIEQVLPGLGGSAHVIIVDGFPFDIAQPKHIQEWKLFAQQQNVGIWFSATLHRESLDLDDLGIPAPVNNFTNFFSVIIMLKPMPDYVDFFLLKSQNQNEQKKFQLKLDPKTLLISNHRV